MNAERALAEALEKGIQLWSEGGRLHYRGAGGELTAGDRDNLRSHKSEIVALLVPGYRYTGLSFGQTRLWFLDRLQSDTAVYNVSAAFELRGRIAVAVLRSAMREIIARHETLRSTFTAFDGRPAQVIAADGEALRRRRVSLPVIDLGCLSGAAREREFRRLSRELRDAPFDLENGPLLRSLLLRLGAGEHHLLLSLHHIVADGWSLGVFRGELADLYTAFVAGGRSPLAPLPMQYADFAAWQRRQLTGERREALLSYWRQRLADPPAALELATDRPRQPLLAARSATCPLAVPPAVAESLRVLGRRQGASLFMTTLAALMVLLYRHSGQRDIAVGCVIANRTRQELERLIGFCVNSLVLRADLTGSPSFRELLRRVREVALSAYAHQELPFEKLVEELQPQRELSRHPLFQVVFALQSAQDSERRLPGAALSPLKPQGQSTEVDLQFSLWSGASGLFGVVSYDSNLFDPATVARLARCYERLLGVAADDPAASGLEQLPVLSRGQQAQLLSEWNDTATEVAARCVHELFEARVERQPDALAVVAGEASLSYRQLDRRANRLAHRLRDLGVGPESLVAVATDRGVEMAWTLLGILKAGGAYLPLDPSYPARRLTFVLEDARPQLLLTLQRPAEQPQRGRSPLRLASDRARVPVLDLTREPLAAPTANPRPLAVPGNLAYVIYTSGSTGRPKGVQISHRAVANFLAAMRREPGLETRDVVVAVTPLAFDIAGLEIFLPLAVGARLVLASREDAVDGGRLRALLSRNASRAGSAVLQATPATWRILLRAGWQGESRIEALCGGETLPRDLADRLLRRCRALWNLYGPTETTIWSTSQRVRSGRSEVAIGRPIANTSVRLLHGLEATPLGVAGELAIGGAGLTRGYLRRPGLTAERLIPDPFSDGRPGERLYRSGDRARFRRDGRLDFLGRLDHQVKVRGQRIELGEIEATLLRQGGVRQAVAVVREEAEDDLRLIAYVVLAAAAAATEETTLGERLREALRSELPSYMVPAAVAVLATLPLTPNGKVDRLALSRRPLPSPATAGSGQGSRTAPPSNVTESLIAGIWRQVLGLEAVGVEDNFFELGGHSLLLAQVQYRLADAIGRQVELVDLLRYPTIRALRRFVEDGAEGRRSAPASAAEPSPPRSLPGREAASEARRESAASAPDVAVIGMAGRFPGARDVEQLWKNLCAGTESVAFSTREELLAEGVPETMLEDPSFVPACARLQDPELFDAELFGYAPREAEILDPQQRIFLECALEALERAGHDPARSREKIGVFAGAGLPFHLLHLINDPAAIEAAGMLQLVLANQPDSLANRVSYNLDLTGPSVSVQTACSTSLVAVHLACQSLLAGSCRLALAGGTSIRPGKRGYLWEPDGIFSPDGHCRAFDERASGTVGGSGAGIVVLKRLADALADGDHIHAVIRGSAINNDGSQKVSFAAPSVEGQAAVIVEALRAAGVAPESLQYVEAHGIATMLADSIEIAALKQVLADGEGDHRCAIGSIKTNLGHLDAASGVAGLIKTVLALEHRFIPPSLHFEKPHPQIGLDASRLYVAAELLPWPPAKTPRRAGVSSFGLGGTNVHVVLQEAPATKPSGPSRSWQLVVLSARTESALEAATANLARHLESHPACELADAAFTLQVGRRERRYRRCLLCQGREDATAALRSPPPAVDAGRAGQRGVVFFFPDGGGSSGAAAPRPCRELYGTEAVFRDQVARCSDLLRPHLGLDLEASLYGAAGGQAAPDGGAEWGRPAVFVVEYALARLLMSWGVQPEAMLGTGVGELVAGCLSGDLELPEALAAAVAAPSGAGISQDLAEDLLERVRHPTRIVLEMGPGEQLSTAAPGPPGKAPEIVAVAALGGADATGSDAESMLRAVARLWLAGARIDWAGFHAGERRRRVPLPTYPFEGRAYRSEAWRAGNAVAARNRRGPTRGRRSVARWFYSPSWRRCRLPAHRAAGASAAAAGAAAAAAGGPCLVFARDDSLCEALVQRLAENRPVVRVVASSGPMQRLGGDVYALDPRDPGSYGALFQALRSADRLPATIVHLWSLSGTAESATRVDWPAFDRAQELGFLSLVYIARALAEAGVAEPVRLLAVGDALQDVSGDEALRPEKATLAAACLMISQEDPLLGCTSVDVKSPRPGSGAEKVLLEQLVREISCAPADAAVAYRGSHRWVRCYEPTPLTLDRGSERSESGSEAAGWLRPRGVYLIVGGLSRLGLGLAEELARSAGARLILTDPSDFPPRQEWDRWLRRSAASDARGRQVRAIGHLEELGAEVLTLRADAADPRQMSAAVERAQRRFGAIHGVLHAAGPEAPETLRAVHEISRADCEARWRPRVRELAVLAELWRDKPLDFCLLFSSTAAVLGGPGRAIDAAAESFAEALTWRQVRHGQPWISVGWDDWLLRGTGPPPRPPRPATEAGNGHPHSGSQAAALSKADCQEVLRRLLRAQISGRIVVSTTDLEARLDHSLRDNGAAPVERAAEPAAALATLHRRPRLSTDYVAPRNSRERTIAGIWQEVLGIADIGAEDSFLELGGDSLLATRILARIRRRFGVDLPLHDFFTDSLAELAEAVQAAQREQISPPLEAAITEEIAEERL